MPTYDVKCSACSHEEAISLRISEVADWDRAAVCPHCGQGTPDYRRIIKMAPSSVGGEKAAARSKTSQRETQLQKFSSSGARDDMRHKESKTRDRNQVGEAIENVRKGKFEGF